MGDASINSLNIDISNACENYFNKCEEYGEIYNNIYNAISSTEPSKIIEIEPTEDEFDLENQIINNNNNTTIIMKKKERNYRLKPQVRKHIEKYKRINNYVEKRKNRNNNMKNRVKL